MPKVSVIMPVYNVELFLRQAIESILRQTFTDFEFIVLNDGSTDRCDEIIRSYNDSRIRYHTQPNRGLIKTLNSLLSFATGDYIARMDSDDSSLPDRLEQQSTFLDLNPECGFVGSWISAIDVTGKYMYLDRYPCSSSFIRNTLLVYNSFAHGSVMMRRSLQPKYDLQQKFVEDYDLWCRLILLSQGHNIPQTLYQWRANPNGESQKNLASQEEAAKIVRREYYHNLQKSGERPISYLDLRNEIQARGVLRTYNSILIFSGARWRLGEGYRAIIFGVRNSILFSFTILTHFFKVCLKGFK